MNSSFITSGPGPKVIKNVSQTQMSMKYLLLIKSEILKNNNFFFLLKPLRCCIILLINVKISTVVDILTFRSRIIFMLSCVEHEKSLITSGPELIMLGFFMHDLNS